MGREVVSMLGGLGLFFAGVGCWHLGTKVAFTEVDLPGLILLVGGGTIAALGFGISAVLAELAALRSIAKIRN